MTEDEAVPGALPLNTSQQDEAKKAKVREEEPEQEATIVALPTAMDFGGFAMDAADDNTSDEPVSAPTPAAPAPVAEEAPAAAATGDKKKSEKLVTSDNVFGGFNWDSK